MTIKKSSDDPSIQHAGKRLMIWLRMPRCHYFVALGKAAYMQAFLIRRPAAKTNAFRGIFFLQRQFIVHIN